MGKKFIKKDFILKYPFVEEEVEKYNISWQELSDIYDDFNIYRDTYEAQADFISNTLRTHDKIHSVKSRVKNGERLLEKIIRKTTGRREKYGDNFQFKIENYKEEINDLIGIRAIHIFKQDWENIHEFILGTWRVIEITANVRDGDNTKRFEELGIEIKSRQSGYRSVHYLIEFYPTSQKVIAEIQVRTIFEEGYGEIDHELRYSHKEIPEILASNLLLFNRIAGSADEMASFINMLSKSLCDMDKSYISIMDEKNHEIEDLKNKITILEQGIQK